MIIDSANCSCLLEKKLMSAAETHTKGYVSNIWDETPDKGSPTCTLVVEDISKVCDQPPANAYPNSFMYFRS